MYTKNRYNWLKRNTHGTDWTNCSDNYDERYCFATKEELLAYIEKQKDRGSKLSEKLFAKEVNSAPRASFLML